MNKTIAIFGATLVEQKEFCDAIQNYLFSNFDINSLSISPYDKIKLDFGFDKFFDLADLGIIAQSLYELKRAVYAKNPQFVQSFLTKSLASVSKSDFFGVIYGLDHVSELELCTNRKLTLVNLNWGIPCGLEFGDHSLTNISQNWDETAIRKVCSLIMPNNPTEAVRGLPDKQLILNIKNRSDISNDCMEELIHRHSGIFIKTVIGHVPPNSLNTYNKREDMLSRKDSFIFEMAMKYDLDNPSGAKFSTFLCNRTRFMCLNQYNESHRKISETIQDPELIPYICDKENFEEGVDTTYCYQETLNELKSAVKQLDEPRALNLIKLRYAPYRNKKLTPWRVIAPQIGLSIQGCIDLHDRTIKKLKNELKNRI